MIVNKLTLAMAVFMIAGFCGAILNSFFCVATSLHNQGGKEGIFELSRWENFFLSLEKYFCFVLHNDSVLISGCKGTTQKGNFMKSKRKLSF